MGRNLLVYSVLCCTRRYGLGLHNRYQHTRGTYGVRGRVTCVLCSDDLDRDVKERKRGGDEARRVNVVLILRRLPHSGGAEIAALPRNGTCL